MLLKFFFKPTQIKQNFMKHTTGMPAKPKKD